MAKNKKYECEVFFPSKEVIDQANIKEYDSLYKKSIKNREGFWAAEAEKLEWFKKWDKVLEDKDKPFYKWFAGGKINKCKTLKPAL